jgi:polysaccharide transporter, PST family
MTLAKTTILTAIATFFKILSGFVINKVAAIYIGPSGLAIVGQLQNFVRMITVFSNGGITQGIVKYTAEYQTISEKRKIFSTSIVVSLLCSLIVSSILIFFSDYWSTLILKDLTDGGVFVVFGATVFLFALNTILVSILNGQGEILRYIYVNISASVFSLFLTSFLIINFSLLGALYAIVVNQSLVFFVTLFFVVRSHWFNINNFTNGLDTKSLNQLGKFSAMALVSIATVPISHLIIRNYIGENLSWDDAGYWQGMWYISTMYLLVVTTSLGVYFLPKLSEIQDKLELKKEILSGYKLIMPVSILMALCIYIFKEDIILIAFSSQFTPMVELFLWQLVGDVIKVASWIIGYLTIAKSMTKIYIGLEIFGSLSFVGLSIYFVSEYGLIGVTYAFAINYIIYFFIMIFIFKWYFSSKNPF